MCARPASTDGSAISYFNFREAMILPKLRSQFAYAM
jgi:hypothetical protein